MEQIVQQTQSSNWSDTESAHHQKALASSAIPHVLLIEDNVVALHFIETITKQAGLTYTSATSGERALELAKSTHFDFIITDIGLPGISGYEFTYAYRHWEKECAKNPIPIIGLTAHALREAKKECLQSGMNTMLSKPISLETIQALVTQFVQHPEPTRSLTSSVLTESNSSLGRDLPDFEEQLFQLNGFPLLNVTLGIQNTGHETVFKQMLQLMLDKEIPETLKSLKEAYDAQDWIAIEKIAHSFKGGAIYCGAMKIQYACQFLEKYSRNGHTDSLETLYQQLITVMHATKNTVSSWLQDTRLQATRLPDRA